MEETEPEETQEEGVQSRMMNMNIPPNYGYGWNGGGTPVGGGGGYMPQPPIPMPTFPGGTGGGLYPPPPQGASAGGGTLYPNIGFNPALLAPAQGGQHMTCPICQRVLTPPIYLCESGHTICNVCIERLDYCTQNDCMCPLEGPRIRNLALEQMCQGHHQQITRVSCPNERDGCPVVIPRENMSDHVEVCEFSGIQFCSKYLGLMECTQRVTRFSLVSHLCESHQVEETEQAKFILNLIAPSSALQSTSPSQQGVVWSPIVVKSDCLEGDQVLLKCFVSPRGYLNLTGYLLSTSSDAEWKRYRIKFGLESVSKVARLEWTGRLIFHHFNQTNTTNASTQMFCNSNTFRIPLHSLTEYVKPTNSHDENLASSKLKIKVCVWKHADDGPTFREPFINFETGEDENPLEKLALLSQFPGDTFSFTDLHEVDHHDPQYMGGTTSRMPSAPTMAYGEEEYTNYYSMDARCTNCTRPLLGHVIYQCLQCPSDAEATYFCRDCIERGNCHGEHLTVRISKPSLQPLAAVAFECSAGELH